MAEISRRVGGRVRDLRKARGLTQEELGERASLSYKFIGEVERGTGNPTIETLASIAAALGVGPEDLLGSNREPLKIGQFSPSEYAAVREAQESLEALLRRFGTERPRRARR